VFLFHLIVRCCLARNLLAATLATLVSLGLVHAQEAWPSKPVKVIIPFAPGSAIDIVTRTVAEELREELGQSLVIENRAGANGFIAAEAVARAAPDGYTLLSTTTTTHSTNPFLFRKLPYDPVKDFIPVGGIHQGYYMVIVRSSMPVKNMAELAVWLKANPQTAAYGWGATASQIAGAAYLKSISASATGVPYKSSPQAVTDLVGGQVSFIVLDVTSGLQQIKNGRVKALAVTSPRRLPQLAEVPTTAEAGIPNMDTMAWTGLFAPAGTPAPIINKLSAALQKALRKPTVAQRLDACCSATILNSTPEEFDAFLQKQRVNWAQKIKAAGIEPE